jgi:hypothetical protein
MPTARRAWSVETKDNSEFPRCCCRRTPPLIQPMRMHIFAKLTYHNYMYNRSIMFHILDLDDDAIAAALGFTDPRTLCSITMTCRRLRALADSTWSVLDKHISNDKRAGGSTPRERVLGSFLRCQKDKWLHQLACAPNKAGLAYSLPNEPMIQNQQEMHMYLEIFSLVDGQKHLDNLFSLNKESMLCSVHKHLSSHHSINMLLANREKCQGQTSSFKAFMKNCFVIFNLSFEDGIFTRRQETAVRKELIRLGAVGVTMLSINGNTLVPKIFFHGVGDKHGPSIRTIRQQDGFYRVEVSCDWFMKKIKPGSIKCREVVFFFQREHFGLEVRMV